jgi:hypothetical protein
MGARRRPFLCVNKDTAVRPQGQSEGSPSWRPRRRRADPAGGSNNRRLGVQRVERSAQGASGGDGFPEFVDRGSRGGRAGARRVRSCRLGTQFPGRRPKRRIRPPPAGSFGDRGRRAQAEHDDPSFRLPQVRTGFGGWGRTCVCLQASNAVRRSAKPLPQVRTGFAPAGAVVGSSSSGLEIVLGSAPGAWRGECQVIGT